MGQSNGRVAAGQYIYSDLPFDAGHREGHKYTAVSTH